MKRLLIFINILFTILGCITIPLAITTPFLFDAPGSENNTYLWIAFWSALALPITCFGFVIASWVIYFKSKNYKKALKLAIIPTLVSMILISSMLMIEIFCNGNFSCPPA